MAVLAQAQTTDAPSPTPQAPLPGLKFTGESGTLITSTLILKAGPLADVVAQVERGCKEDRKKPAVDLPNLVYAKDTRDVVMPGDPTLRRVTPVQALALAAAAAEFQKTAAKFAGQRDKIEFLTVSVDGDAGLDAARTTATINMVAAHLKQKGWTQTVNGWASFEQLKAWRIGPLGNKFDHDQ